MSDTNQPTQQDDEITLKKNVHSISQNIMKSFLGNIGFYVAQFFRFFPLNGIPHKIVVFFQRFNPAGRNKDFSAGNGYILTKETNNLLYISGLYEYRLLKYIHGLLKDNDTFMDIGANAGTSLLWLHFQSLRKKINFIAFEPMPGNIVILNKNLALNPNVSCQVYPFALGSKSETQNFSTTGDGDGSARIEYLVKSKTAKKREIIPVEVKPLDLLHQDHEIPKASVILIDVEGFAGEVLRGGTKYISSYKPTIIVEIHDKNEQQEVKDILQSCNYTLLTSMTTYGLHLVFENRQ